MHSSDTTKYLIHLHIEAEGVVEKPDVVGAIFGQTEGLLGEDLDLRDLQRSGRVGRIDVQITSRKGETSGEILISSSLDRAETAILAATLESIDRVGPCLARVTVTSIEDIRVSRRRKIVDRARELLLDSFEEGVVDSQVLLDQVRESIRIEKIITLGEEKVPAGPNVPDSDAIIVVEGRADVLNLLRYGIKNAVAVEGTHIPPIIINLCEKKTSTAFFDGDRGGELILRELLQKAEVDYVAFPPANKSVEDMTRKEIVKALRNKVPAEYIIDQTRATQDSGAEHEEPQAERGADHGENVVTKVTAEPIRKPRSGISRRQKEPGKRVFATLEDQLEAVKGHHIARFLSPDLQVLKEVAPSDIEAGAKDLDGNIAGLVTDGEVTQRILDLLVSRGVSYVAAREFKGIIKRPLSIRLLKMA